MTTAQDATGEKSSAAVDVASWLNTPAAYLESVEHVETIETHISKLFLVGSRVYKLKKCVKYDFLDFSTIDQREHACRAEVRLNRRLAPDVYRRVVPVTLDADGNLLMDGEGEVVDWLVEMQRLPSDKTMDVLHRRGLLRPYHIDQLAELLVRFYSTAEHVSITPRQYRDRCLRHVRENLKELRVGAHHLSPLAVERIHGFQLQLLQLEPELFDDRVQQRRIVDGHGDLRPEHICFADSVVIFDCIEFQDEFRQLDVADELAFLVEECDLLGAAWVERRLLARFQQLTESRVSPRLFSFYKAYRASVRAKVAALRADQLTGKSQREASQDSVNHLGQADRSIAPFLTPLVILIGGASGTGKSTLAKKLATALGAQLLRTDLIRRELFSRRRRKRSPTPDVYEPDARARVYDEMFERARGLNLKGLSVVLDGTFSTSASVRGARGVAIDPRSIFLAVECHCRPEVARQRIVERLNERRDASEATPELHDQQRSEWEEWPSYYPHCQVDTEQTVAKQVRQVLAELSRQVRARSSSREAG